MKIFNKGGAKPCGWFVYVLRVTLSLCFCIFAIGAPPAWSFERVGLPNIAGEIQVNSSKYSEFSSSESVDACASLLKSTYSSTSPSSSGLRTQRSAGKVAAFGLVIGLRFALPPTKSYFSPRSKKQNIVSVPSFDVRLLEPAAGGETSHAMVVAAYRQCRKDKALQALRGL